MKTTNLKSALLLISVVCSFQVIGQNIITLQPDATTGKDAVLHGLASEVNTNYENSPHLTAATWTFNGT